MAVTIIEGTSSAAASAARRGRKSREIEPPTTSGGSNKAPQRLRLTEKAAAKAATKLG